MTSFVKWLVCSPPCAIWNSFIRHDKESKTVGSLVQNNNFLSKWAQSDSVKGNNIIFLFQTIRPIIVPTCYQISPFCTIIFPLNSSDEIESAASQGNHYEIRTAVLIIDIENQETEPEALFTVTPGQNNPKHANWEETPIKASEGFSQLSGYNITDLGFGDLMSWMFIQN